MKYYIINMHSIRSKMALKNELKKLNIPYRGIEIGMFETTRDISKGKFELLRNNLLQTGLELATNRDEIIAENIAKTIIESIQYSSESVRINISDILQEKLQNEYAHLENIFLEIKGISIEQFLTEQKIEHAMDLHMSEKPGEPDLHT